MASALEALALGALTALGLWWLARGPRGRAAAALLGVAAAAFAWQVEAPGPAVAGLPGPSPDEALTTSAACRACHPSAYASWEASYHRTMTQPATPATVRGDFDGVVLRDRGAHVRLERQGERFLAHLLDPAGQVIRSRPVVMTTGSHHFQNYWLAEDDGWYAQLPFLWRIDDARWLPVQDSFLHPDTPTPQNPSLWNGNCGYCHSVGHAGRLGAEAADSRAAELGIACEACHGPGERHRDHYRDPLARYREVPAADDPIRVPSKLQPERETAVCGQCHGIFMRTDLAATHQQGDPFRPGDPLDETRQLFVPRPDPSGRGGLLIPPFGGPVAATLLTPFGPESAEIIGYTRDGISLRSAASAGPGVLRFERREGAADLQLAGQLEAIGGGHLRLAPGPGWPADTPHQIGRRLGWRGQIPTWFDLDAFWPDGTVRSTGREANALAVTGCSTRGPMSCSSCHRMHGYAERADMLAPGMDGDEACLQCHQDLLPDLQAHTHHPPGSSGARCYNCHMPHTTFGLLGAIRSHRVDSPSADRAWRTGRPDACSLCHIDRPLGWTARQLTAWYGQPPLGPLPAPWDTTAAAAVWALQGDGAQRGVAAWALGWAPARAVGGATWTAPILAALVDDPDYAAVRTVAERALRGLPGFADWGFDFVADPAQRAAAAAEAARRAAALRPDRAGPAALRDPTGGVDTATLQGLRARRDRRPVQIAE